MKHFQPFLYTLPTQTYAAGGRGTQTLRDIPKTMFGKFCHLIGFLISNTLTPTWATAGPDTVGMNNLMTSCDFWDGSFLRFQGGLNHVRFKEQLGSGRHLLPDTEIDTASTSARYWKKFLSVGPLQFAGSPSDFALPVGCLENGELRISYGSLTDLAGNAGGTVSAATGSSRIVAVLALLDEIRIPPAYTFRTQAMTGKDANLPGRAMYESIGLLNSDSFDALTAGDVGDVTIDMGFGPVVNAIHRQDIMGCFEVFMETGEFSPVYGDQVGATDFGPFRANLTSMTAIATSELLMQPLLFSPRNTRITKMFMAESSCRVRTSGTQSTFTVVYGRLEAQSNNVVAQYAAKALSRLGLQAKKVEPKTLSKKAYSGQLSEFMPWKVSL